MQDTNYKLRAWMGANRVTGVELAEKIDMPYDTFKVKMADKSQWKLSEVIALMDATGMPFEELF